MKVLRTVGIILAAALLLASCGSMAQGALSGAIGAIGAPSLGSGSSGSAAASVASFDFQSGEILASPDTRKMVESRYNVAKVLTPASAATKNQAEVVFVHNGTKSWVNYVLNSRKATKADLVVGATLFHLAGWAGYDEIGAESYRKDPWELGNITSIEELYKNRVEISGEHFNINYLRVPTDPIK